MDKLFQESYSQLIDQLKKEIRSASIKATLSVNLEMLRLYWKIGKSIAERENKKGWGARIVVQLSKDLQSAFPEMKGFSVRNLRYMREFATSYPSFLQQATQNSATSLEDGLHFKTHENHGVIILQAPLAKLTWYHHITLMDKVKDIEQRIFYMNETVQNNWSRNVLALQIESNLYKRQGKAITNFEQTLTPPQNDLAKELIKDPYRFDFLNLYEEYKERELENALVDNLTRFLLELGAGFCFVGRQYKIEVGGNDYAIDLLFYHFKLRCFVVVELKTGGFMPEYAGKLNFYLNVLDDIIKQPGDNASIGILICKERNKIVTEYALRGINKPIGVSEFQLTEALPDNLKGSLPTIQQIAKGLEDK